MEALAALLRLLLWLAVVASSHAQQRPRCRRQCGNVTVPYPFGIGAGCHHGATANGFRLRCDARRRRLTVAGYGHVVAAISVPKAEATVLLNASRACYDRPSGRVVGRREKPMALNGSAFLFSSMKSKFVSIGCPGLSYFFDGGGGLRDRVHETTFLENSTACSYAFMVDAMWFWLAGARFNRTGDFAVPVILDWAIRDAPGCAAARRDAGTYACRSAHAVCLESSNGPGYICNCTDGYEGNPYVTDGCSDVNECERRDEFLCYGVCINTPGSFICTCPKGSSGNATTWLPPRHQVHHTALKAVSASACSCCCWSASRRTYGFRRGGCSEQSSGSSSRTAACSCISSWAPWPAPAWRSASSRRRRSAGLPTASRRRASLGRGGHGVVYKGVLPDGSAVAVKRSMTVDARQVREFAREMLILSQINHRHVVKLVGCCLEVEVPMLVYEYVPNGNLSSQIHGGGVLLPPAARLRVAAESADALAYMHSSASPPILHRDVKSANILLDGDLAAKVADLGASRLAPAGEAAAVATMVQGTLGYLDPEYLLTCQLTSKSDVYSFAVVVLELLTGRKAFVPVEDEEEEDEEGSLAFWFLRGGARGDGIGRSWTVGSGRSWESR
ncbi:hypothetical protein PR202_ga20089 [Eleusine coracana subsp. coracana]|uniref:Protein kinase domain-containing protein n=1 Tax=Eleusine coracana subsp. coracana TaxID=191504 RepID=A0AAV5CWZ4_ELECO|nr:hypothetical protein PR202_ga20089 [Eleusine coracana subsp. coracana]